MNYVRRPEASLNSNNGEEMFQPGFLTKSEAFNGSEVGDFFKQVVEPCLMGLGFLVELRTGIFPPGVGMPEYRTLVLAKMKRNNYTMEIEEISDLMELDLPLHKRVAAGLVLLSSQNGLSLENRGVDERIEAFKSILDEWKVPNLELPIQRNVRRPFDGCDVQVQKALLVGACADGDLYLCHNLGCLGLFFDEKAAEGDWWQLIEFEAFNRFVGDGKARPFGLDDQYFFSYFLMTRY